MTMTFAFKSLGLMLATSAALLGCGGGGDNAGTPNDTTGNPFVEKLGTYTNTCTQTSYSGETPRSTSVTLVLSAPLGSDKVTASYRSKEYIGSVICDTASLDSDLTVSGTLQALSATKTISPMQANGGLIGTASTANFSLESVTVVQTSLSIPALGTTAKVGYKFVGTNIYALINPKDESDGLGAYFSSVFMVKQ